MGYKEWMELQDARNALIDRMGLESMTREQGEKIATELGIAPLETIPNPADYAPEKEPVWSLRMAFAWIMWRNMNAVREFWDAYRAETFRLHFRSNCVEPGIDGMPVTRDRWFLKQDEPLGMESLAIYAELDGMSLIVPYLDAKRELISAFVNEDIVASGFNTQTAEPAQIPVHIWQSGEITLRDTGISFEPEVTTRPFYRGYKNISVSSREIIRLWPAFMPGKSNLPNHKVTLHEAVLCLARNEMDFTHEQIDSLELFGPAAKMLFQMLYAGEATADGLRLDAQIRSNSDELHPYWECAYESPEPIPQAGHFISFGDGLAFDGSGFGGTLTPQGEQEPRWADIRVQFKPVSSQEGLTSQRQLEPTSNDTKRKRGRKPTSYEGFIEEHAAVFAEHGVYGDGHPLFAAPGDVKGALGAWFEKKFKGINKPIPSEQSLYRYIAAMQKRYID